VNHKVPKVFKFTITDPRVVVKFEALERGEAYQGAVLHGGEQVAAQIDALDRGVPDDVVKCLSADFRDLVVR